MVAVVGPTGAGKTTLVSLLLRFYTPQKGSITIDGLPIQQYTRDGLRRRLAIVLQDGWLCGGTIAGKHRLRQCRALSRAQIEAAAKAACIHSFLSSRRMDMIPHSLTAAPASPRASGSCWPLPRCFLSNADIVILDEATSDVDPETEEQISARPGAAAEGAHLFPHRPPSGHSAHGGPHPGTAGRPDRRAGHSPAAAGCRRHLSGPIRCPVLLTAPRIS